MRGEELGSNLWVVWRLLATECWLQNQRDSDFSRTAAIEWALPTVVSDIETAYAEA
jgi:hypothetical protein